MGGATDELTRCLSEAAAGSQTAFERAFSLVYHELRDLAAIRLAALPPGITLQPTALVNEAYLKLAVSADQAWSGRAHFFGAAANAVRNILVDHVRRRGADKRGGGRARIELVDEPLTFDADSETVLAVDRALERLRAFDPDSAQVVDLRFFAGLTHDQIARVIDVSTRSVERRWRFARAWLARWIEDASQGAHRDS